MANSPKKIKRSWVKPKAAFDREIKDDKFYNSWPWRKLRKRFLLSNPLCLHCDRNGIVTAATVADHITPIKQGGEPLDESNLQALCEKCHNRKSASESRG